MEVHVYIKKFSKSLAKRSAIRVLFLGNKFPKKKHTILELVANYCDFCNVSDTKIPLLVPKQNSETKLNAYKLNTSFNEGNIIYV